LAKIAPRIIWFEPPEQAIADPARFLAYLMTFATADDLAFARLHVDADQFALALDHAPPGVMDGRSWWYWNAISGRYPPPPMPQRKIPG
jgi:hypothetical protein